MHMPSDMFSYAGIMKMPWHFSLAYIQNRLKNTARRSQNTPLQEYENDLT